MSFDAAQPLSSTTIPWPYTVVPAHPAAAQQASPAQALIADFVAGRVAVTDSAVANRIMQACMDEADTEGVDRLLQEVVGTGHVTQLGWPAKPSRGQVTLLNGCGQLDDVWIVVQPLPRTASREDIQAQLGPLGAAALRNPCIRNFRLGDGPSPKNVEQVCRLATVATYAAGFGLDLLAFDGDCMSQPEGPWDVVLRNAARIRVLAVKLERPAQCDWMFKVLRSAKGLTRLTVDPLCQPRMIERLAVCKSLEHLELGNLPLGDAAMAFALARLGGSLPALRTIALTHIGTPLRDEKRRSLARDLRAGFEDFMHLEHADLAHCGLSAQEVLDAMQGRRPLRTLLLPSQRAAAEHPLAIQEGLLRCPAQVTFGAAPVGGATTLVPFTPAQQQALLQANDEGHAIAADFPARSYASFAFNLHTQWIAGEGRRGLLPADVLQRLAAWHRLLAGRHWVADLRALAGVNRTAQLVVSIPRSAHGALRRLGREPLGGAATAIVCACQEGLTLAMVSRAKVRLRRMLFDGLRHGRLPQLLQRLQSAGIPAQALAAALDQVRYQKLGFDAAMVLQMLQHARLEPGNEHLAGVQASPMPLGTPAGVELFVRYGLAPKKVRHQNELMDWCRANGHPGLAVAAFAHFHVPVLSLEHLTAADATDIVGRCGPIETLELCGGLSVESIAALVKALPTAGVRELSLTPRADWSAETVGALFAGVAHVKELDVDLPRGLGDEALVLWCDHLMKAAALHGLPVRLTVPRDLASRPAVTALRGWASQAGQTLTLAAR